MQATNNKVDEQYIIPIARELAIGLDAVHKAKVMHRDVKGMSNRNWRLDSPTFRQSVEIDSNSSGSGERHDS